MFYDNVVRLYCSVKRPSPTSYINKTQREKTVKRNIRIFKVTSSFDFVSVPWKIQFPWKKTMEFI